MGTIRGPYLICAREKTSLLLHSWRFNLLDTPYFDEVAGQGGPSEARTPCQDGLR